MSRKQQAMAAVRTNPKSSKAWADLGDALAEEGQYEKAKESYQRALQLDPANGKAQQGLAATISAALMQDGPPPAAPEAASPPPRETSTRSKTVDTPAPKAAAKESSKTAPRPAAAAPPPPPRGSAGMKGTITLRRPLPKTVRPSQGRLMAGVGMILALPLLCLCGFVLLLAQLTSGG